MADNAYTEYLQLRKAGVDGAPPPSPHASDVRVYADTGGALRTVQSDGTDAAVGSGGGSTPVRVFSGSGAPTAPANTYFSLGPAGDPNTSGTFKLIFRGQTTEPIAFDATSDDVAAALALLTPIGDGNAVAYPGYEASALNDGVYVVFDGVFMGEAVETPTVADDTTDHGIAANDIAAGTAGVPEAAVAGDIYADLTGFVDLSGPPPSAYTLLPGALPVWLESISLPVSPDGGIQMVRSSVLGNGSAFAASQLEDGRVLFSLQGVVYVATVGGEVAGPDNWLFYIVDVDDGATPWGIKSTGHEAISAVPGVPPDALAKTSERVQFYDDTNGAPAMRYKQRSADGTLSTGIALGSTGSQDTVGAAGAAADLPAKPSKYIKVTDEAGNHYVIPAYAVS